MRLLTSLVSLLFLVSACSSNTPVATASTEVTRTTVSPEVLQPSQPADGGVRPVLVNGPEVDFCGTLFEFFDARSKFRQAIGSGTPVGNFPDEARETWDEMRRVAEELEDQMYQHGPLVDEETSSVRRRLDVDALVGIEHELRLAVFAEPSIGLSISEAWEEGTGYVNGWAKVNCGFDGIEVPPTSAYKLPHMAAWGESEGKEQNYCARIEDALRLRAVISDMMVADDFHDPDRVSDLDLTVRKYGIQLWELEEDYRLATGELILPFVGSFEYAPSNAFFYAVHGGPVEDVIREEFAEDDQFLNGVLSTCSEIEPSLVERARGLEAAMDAAAGSSSPNSRNSK